MVIVERQHGMGYREGKGWVGEEGDEEKGQTAEDRVLSRHLAEAKREEEAKKMRETGKGRNWRMEDWQMREKEAGEQALLKQLLQGTGEEESCGEQKTEREQDEKEQMHEERPQCKAKAAFDLVAQVQREEVCEEQKGEGGKKTQEESFQEVGQPYLVVTRWEDKSGGTCGGEQAVGQEVELKGEEESAGEQVKRVDMDVLLQNVQRLTEVVEKMGNCGQN